MSDLSSIRLVNLIRDIAKKEVKNNETMIFGTVVKVDPLEIDIGNNIVLTKEFLFLGQMCRPHKVKIPHTHQYNGTTENGTTGISATTTATVSATPTPGVITIIDSGHTHDIKNQVTEDVHKQGTDFEECVVLEIEPVLQKDDKVLMFAFNNNQMYYVAERIEK